MKIKKDGKVITLSESDLRRIVKRVLNEQTGIPTKCLDCVTKALGEKYTKKATKIAEMLMKMETPELSDIVELLDGVELMDAWTIGPKLLQCSACMKGGNPVMY